MLQQPNQVYWKKKKIHLPGEQVFHLCYAIAITWHVSARTRTFVKIKYPTVFKYCYDIIVSVLFV